MTITIKEWGYLENPYLQDPYLDTLVYGQMGMQFQAITATPVGMQFRAVIYNTKFLRIMSAFPSRGDVGTGGNNAWGQPKGTGLNWSATSTEPGDFEIKNVNNDIVEHLWRSASGVTTSIILKCDAEIDQGIFTDQLAILNHNLSSSAVVQFQGSNSSTFSSVGFSVNLQVTPENMYYIAPTLPINGYRYWRLVIDDSTNTDGFVSIGTIIFGVSSIFTNGAFGDVLSFGFKDFADTVETEGYTNVANSRALKRILSLNFPVQDALLGNFRILRTLMRTFRTTHKVLVIPTPSATDQTITDQYAVFSKIVPPLPQWTTKYVADELQYSDLSLTWDESR